MTSKLRELIELKVGKRILLSYIRRDGKFKGPLMMPPIPESKFIDKLPDGIPLQGQNAAEKELQDGFETEVILYRCLERVNRDILVLHQVDYSHEQYSAFLPSHLCNKKNCRKNCRKDCPKDCSEHPQQPHSCHNKLKNIEGECDFIVIGNYFVAVFEVKGLNLSSTSDDEMIRKKFDGCCNDALRQRKRMVELITAIDPSVTVHEFTVLCNISRKEAAGSYDNLIFKDDLIDFAKWFDDNIPSLPTSSDDKNAKIENLKAALLGLWCINIDNKWDVTKCSLTKCIKDIDEKLRQAHVTRRSIEESQLKLKKSSGKNKMKNKNYPENDMIREASYIFTEYLNVNCLTSHQQEMFESKNRLLWVDGPAGSGKTVVMIGKIIQLALDPVTTSLNRKVILVLPDFVENTVEEYHQTFFNNLKKDLCEMISVIDLEDPLPKVTQCASTIILLKTRFLGVDYLVNLLCSLTKSGGHYIFIDDLHLDIFAWWAAQSGPTTLVNPQSPLKSNLIDMIYELAMSIYENQEDANSWIWILCDLAQQDGHEMFHQTNVHSKQLNALKLIFEVKTLSVNLRNTFDISSFLEGIRRYFEKRPWYNLATEWQSYLPKQQIGHFYRGTIPVIYLIDDDSDYTVVLADELRKLVGHESHLDISDIGLLYSDVCSDRFAKIRSERNVGDMKKTSYSFTEKHRDTITKTVDRLLEQDEIKGKIDVECNDNCRSMEWPAVVAVIVEKMKLIPALYLAVSRARVYCTIILVGRNDYTMGELKKELEETPGTCRFVNVPPT